jgi:exosome complex component RRP42
MITATLTKAYGAPGVLDYKKLCPKPDAHYWLLYVDLIVLSFGGNVIDAAAFAAKCALFDTRLPTLNVVEEPDSLGVSVEVDSDARRCERIDISGAPVVVTFLCVGNQLVVDPNVDEDSCAEAKIVVAVGPDCVNSMTKFGDACMFQKTLDAAMEKAVVLGEELDSSLMEALTKADEEALRHRE